MSSRTTVSIFAGVHDVHDVYSVHMNETTSLVG